MTWWITTCQSWQTLILTTIWLLVSAQYSPWLTAKLYNSKRTQIIQIMLHQLKFYVKEIKFKFDHQSRVIQCMFYIVLFLQTKLQPPCHLCRSTVIKQNLLCSFSNQCQLLKYVDLIVLFNKKTEKVLIFNCWFNKIRHCHLLWGTGMDMSLFFDI